MSKIFLSYDRDDGKQARPLAAALEKAGHSVWWDKHIGGGTQYSKEIEQALNGADVVVVLWSLAAIESPWVRDEAGAGRDKGRLVPLSLAGVSPPLGFRQFQAINLGRWQGRGKVPRFDEILAAIGRHSQSSDEPPSATLKRAPIPHSRIGPSANMWALIAVCIVIAFVAIGLLIGRPWERVSAGTPTVGVVAADNSPASQAIARGVLAAIGTLQGNSATNFRLIDDAATEQPDLRVSVGAAGDKNQGTVALASSKDKSVVWSRQIQQADGQHGNLEQALAYAAMTALTCAASNSGGASALRPNELRAFLNSCFSSEEVGDSDSLVTVFRRTVDAAPKFAPGWANLLLAERDVLANAAEVGDPTQALRSRIRQDIDSARKIDPEMPEATIAEIELQPPRAFLGTMSLLDKALSANPDNPALLSEQTIQSADVGRNEDALEAADRATQLKPYSLVLRERYILTLAASGGVEKARSELAEAKQLWPDAPSLANAEVSLNLRYGDFEKTWRAAGLPIDGGITGYFKILRDPSDANIDAWINLAKTHKMLHPHRIFILQALGPLNRVDQLYQFLDQWPIDKDLEGLTYLLFRPWTKEVRRDPRFMRLAQRVGLLDYWEKSGKWPDFCAEPDMPYDCKKEAAKLAS